MSSRYEHPATHDTARRSSASALAQLAGQGTLLHYTHQNIAELWNAMTRPLNRNGLGLTVADAEREVRAIEAGMNFLPDSEAVLSGMAADCLSVRCVGVQGAGGRNLTGRTAVLSWPC